MKKHWKSMAVILAVSMLICMLIMPAAGTPSDHTPTADATLAYNISNSTAGWAGYIKSNFSDAGLIVSGKTIYAPLYNGTDQTKPGTPVLNATGTVPSGAAYWMIDYDSTSNRATPTLVINHGKLLRVESPAAFDNVTGKINGYDVQVKSAEIGTENQYDKGDTAIVVDGGTQADTYYVRARNGWGTAVAKVTDGDGSTVDYYYTQLSGSSDCAVEEANAKPASATTELLLLADVDVTTTVSIGANVTIYCCNDSVLTVATGGVLTLNGKVYDNNEAVAKDSTFLCVKDGGALDDVGGNTVCACYSENYSGTNSLVTGHGGTTLFFLTETVFRLVDIQGSFAYLGGHSTIAGAVDGGHYRLAADTTILHTLSGSLATGNDVVDGDAVINERAEAANLTVKDGRVHILSVNNEFVANYPIHLWGGDLYINLPGPANVAYVTGVQEGQTGGSGNVYVVKGSAYVNGVVANLNVFGTDDINYGGHATLTGTASNATVHGRAILTVTKDGGHMGAVTNQVTGSAAVVNGVSYYGRVQIATEVTETIRVQGTFWQVIGSATMSNDLTIEDISTKTSITGGTYKLTTLGAGDLTQVPYDTFKLLGTFKSLDIREAGIDMQGITVKESLSASHADINVIDGTTIGSSDAPAQCTVQNSVLTVKNSTAYAKVEGLPANLDGETTELHIDTKTTGCIGASGTFDSLTGAVDTCGDLTVNSTVDNATYGSSSAVITGGMTPYAFGTSTWDTGMTWDLVLNDSKGSTAVQLANGKDNAGTAQNPGFASITVDDTHTDGNVSLTMKTGALPVNIGANVSDCYANTGLKVTGDANTVVTLKTNDIYGTQYGVNVAGSATSPVNVTLTGDYSNSTLKAVTNSTSYGHGVDAAMVSYGTLNMDHYALTGFVNGVTVKDSSTANLHDIRIAGTEIGLNVAGTGCTANLENTIADTTNSIEGVTGKTGILVDGGSALNLKNTVTVCGVNKGINVADGTVSNAGDTAKGTSVARLIKTTGDGSTVLRIVKGSAVMDSYTFNGGSAKNSTGVYVADGTAESPNIATLTYGNTDQLTLNGYLWGQKLGIFGGYHTTVTISDYKVYGMSSRDQNADVFTGDAGARMNGTLQLTGNNTFLGGQYGIDVIDGTVTNYWKDAAGADEQTGTAQGSGSILSGKSTPSTALRLTGSSGTPVATLKNYTLNSAGVTSGNGQAVSYGLDAQAGRVYLEGTPAAQEKDATVLYGNTGVNVAGGAKVAMDGMLVKSTAASGYAGTVLNGSLSLGKAVTAPAATGHNTFRGLSADHANLFVQKNNTGIKAEGGYENLTGYVTTSDDLAIQGTSGAAAYATAAAESAADYNDCGYALKSVRILGGGATHALTLGTNPVNATLENDGVFECVQATGTAAVQQQVTVAGNLTVTATAGNGFDATYADVIFTPVSETTTAANPTPFTRTISTAAANASAMSAGTGAKIYLTDTLALTAASGTGLKLTGSAMVTDLQSAGTWLTAYPSDTTALNALSTGMITAKNTVDVSGSAVLLLGKYKLTATECGLNASGDAEVYLLAGSGVDEKTISAANGSAVVVNVNSGKRVAIRNYTEVYSSAAAAAVKVNNGTVLLDSDGISTKNLTAKALEIAGTSADSLPDVTLDGSTVVDSNAVECVSIQGYDASHPAKLTVQGAACVANLKDPANPVARTIVGGGNANLSVTSTATAAATIRAIGTFESITGNTGKTLCVDTTDQKSTTADTLTINSALSVPTTQVKNGSLTMVKTNVWTSGNVEAGTAALGGSFKRDYTHSLYGTLTVKNGQITSFPSAIMNNDSQFTGWYVSGKADTVYSINSTYSILGGEVFCVKYQFLSGGGGGGGGTSTLKVNTTTTTTKEGVEGSTWGDLKVNPEKTTAGKTVTVTPNPKTSFTVNSITVTDAKKNKITVTDNGDGTYSFTMPSTSVSLNVEYTPALGTKQTTPASTRVMRAYHKVFLNGKEIDLDAYNINYNNYFKLRDIAYILNETNNKFSVDFANRKIYVTTGENYTPVGGECEIGKDRSATCVASDWTLVVNGETRYLKCYNLGQNNYFQLRELGAVLGFKVEFDESTWTVQITTVP